MSQIDQAFIKAYRQQTSQSRATTSPPQPAAPPVPGTLTRGAQLRVDAPHQAEPAVPGARVPTPHLQMPLPDSALADAQTARRPAPLSAPSQSRTAASSPRVWSPRARMGQATHSSPQPQATTSTHDVEITVQKTTPSQMLFVGIEEALLRLVDGAAEDQSVRQVTDEATSVVPLAPPAPTAPAAEPTPASKLVSDQQITEIALPKREAADPQAQPVAAPPAPVEPAPVREVASNEEDAPGEAAEKDDPTGDAVEDEPRAMPVVEQAPPETVAEQPVIPPEAPAAAKTVDDVLDDSADNKTEDETSVSSFQAVWEVDAFQWPEVIDRLRDAADAELTTAGNSLAASVQKGAKLLAITGAAEGAGATTLALALARNLASAGRQVALVDANFDRPMLAELLGVRVQDGWEAALTGNLPLEEVCITSVGDGVTLVPLVDGSGATATQASLHAAGLLTRLAEVFDVVLIDAGSGSENVAAVATSSDGVLDVPVLVAVDDRQQNRPLTLETIGHLKQCALGNIQVAEMFAA